MQRPAQVPLPGASSTSLLRSAGKQSLLSPPTRSDSPASPSRAFSQPQGSWVAFPNKSLRDVVLPPEQGERTDPDQWAHAHGIWLKGDAPNTSQESLQREKACHRGSNRPSPSQLHSHQTRASQGRGIYVPPAPSFPKCITTLESATATKTPYSLPREAGYSPYGRALTQITLWRKSKSRVRSTRG